VSELQHAINAAARTLLELVPEGVDVELSLHHDVNHLHTLGSQGLQTVIGGRNLAVRISVERGVSVASIVERVWLHGEMRDRGGGPELWIGDARSENSVELGMTGIGFLALL
jgi:hypothetical protein